jgi:hypothetical protein
LALQQRQEVGTILAGREEYQLDLEVQEGVVGRPLAFLAQSVWLVWEGVEGVLSFDCRTGGFVQSEMTCWG